ncbi:MAG: hypothetical protein Q8P41_29290 [Pseudomonadota bacterium]|nr:hypothetical protein [Pseudomonadota bacterium]
MPTVWLVGAGGRTPFVGHLRGARDLGPVRLAWAGRVAGSGSVAEGWEAAEAARDALADLRAPAGPIHGALEAVLAAACTALAGIDARWIARGDMSVLLVATDGTRARAAGSGLGAVHGSVGGAWRPLVGADHPLLGEPGAPGAASHDVPLADVWVGVPVGLPFPKRDLPLACGVHP